MYKDLKLEKGMYHITGKSFSEVLESMDPPAAMPKHRWQDWMPMSAS